MLDLFRIQQDLFLKECAMVMMPWLRIVLKVVIMAATMCTGIIIVKHGVRVEDQGHGGRRDIRQDRQGLDRAA